MRVSADEAIALDSRFGADCPECGVSGMVQSWLCEACYAEMDEHPGWPLHEERSLLVK